MIILHDAHPLHLSALVIWRTLCCLYYLLQGHGKVWWAWNQKKGLYVSNTSMYKLHANSGTQWLLCWLLQLSWMPEVEVHTKGSKQKYQPWYACIMCDSMHVLPPSNFLSCICVYMHVCSSHQIAHSWCEFCMHYKFTPMCMHTCSSCT